MTSARRQSVRCAALSALAGCLLAVACTQPGAQANPAPTPVPGWMLGETFSIGMARCSVASVREYLTEAKVTTDSARVAPDVHAVGLSLDCRAPTGVAVATAEALPSETVILLVSPDGQTRAPSARTWLSEEQPDLLVFEVPAAQTQIARTRRYDANTGERKSTPDRAFATLRLQTGPESVDVLLRPRALTPAFERALDAFMRELAQPSASVLSDAQKAQRAILAYAKAREIAVSANPSLREPWLLALEYDPTARRAFTPALNTLRLQMAPSTASEPLRVVSIEGLAEIERGSRCARERESLRARAAQAYAQGDTERDCHVLGLLLPGACDAVEPALLSSALESLSRCIEPASLRSSRGVPDDFQLTLRRGRVGSALDRAPRYTLSLFAGGQVVFHGRHWVNQLGRSDGRTAESVLGGLYAHMLALEWFDRRGGVWSAEACNTDDEHGNLITLHAAGRERMILDREGCRGPFSARELDELRLLMEAAAGLESFTEARPEYADTRARIWTIE